MCIDTVWVLGRYLGGYPPVGDSAIQLLRRAGVQGSGDWAVGGDYTVADLGGDSPQRRSDFFTTLARRALSFIILRKVLVLLICIQQPRDFARRKLHFFQEADLHEHPHFAGKFVKFVII